MYAKMFVLCLIFNLVLLKVHGNVPCDLREAEHGHVCVCSSTYCDTVPLVEKLPSGHYQIFTTSKDNLGFYSRTGIVSSLNATASVKIDVANLTDTHQTIIGFGTTFTDSAGINIADLSQTAQDNLFESYFGESGVEYSLGRVPIGGTDFSTRGYTYCDEEDLTLEKFALADDDYSYKLPFIKKALDARKGKQLTLFASVWTAPAWAKSNNSTKGSGELKDEYYGWWAQYFIKFFEAYQSNGVKFWGVTAQNEPTQGFMATGVPNLKYSYDQMKTWIKDYLGPAIRNSSFSDLKIMVHDDSRDALPLLKLFVLSDEDVLKYIDGIGLHWYTDFFTPASVLDYAKSDKKDLFVLATEACNGYIRLFDVMITAVELGSWTRGVNYINDIFDDLEHNVAGWTDWNMVLNPSGGPTWIDNNVDSPIIVNATSGEFYKQPMFYALGHFSKFVIPNSIRVATHVSSNKLRALTFKRPDNKIAVVISNNSDDTIEVEISIESTSSTIEVSSYSINTVLFTV